MAMTNQTHFSRHFVIHLFFCLMISLGYAYPVYAQQSFDVSDFNNYLDRCRPCRTSIALSEEDIRDVIFDNNCENPVCPPNPYELYTYFGINYKQFWVQPLNDWQRLFVKTNPGFNFYFGARMYTFFGLELGYEWTANKSISTAIAPGSSLLGLSNTNPFSVRIAAKQRLRSGYVDFNMFIPFLVTRCFQPEAIFSVGVAAVRPSVKLQAFPSAEPYRTELLPVNGRGKTLLRLGAGLQSLIINNIGMRILWQWQNTSALKFQKSPVVYAPDTRNIFKNSQTLSAGFYFYF